MKQKLAFREVVKGVPITRAMAKVGYRPSTALRTNKLTRSDGWKQLCEDAGLTDELLTHALVTDIRKKKGNRVRELELGFKVRGRLNQIDNGGNTYNFNFLTIEQQQRIARRVQAGDTASPAEPDRLPDSDEPGLRTELAP